MSPKAVAASTGNPTAAMVAPKTLPKTLPKSALPKTSTGGSAAPTTKMHRRSRSGCFTCRLRRKKCDEGKPSCKACKHLGLGCEYKRPSWWSNNEKRRNEKENIKNIIKNTKLTEKTSQANATGADSPPGLTHSLPTSATHSDAATRTRGLSVDSVDYDFNQPPRPFDGHAYNVYAPTFAHPHLYPEPPLHIPYEVDIKTERQTFVNDVPTRHDSSTSTFSTFHPPTLQGGLPSMPEEAWMDPALYDEPAVLFSPPEEGLDFHFFDFSHGSTQHLHESVIQVDDCDRPLLDHFLDNVLHLIFPILEVNQHGSARSEVILPALAANRCYLHCCLSIAAIHCKSTQAAPTEQLDNDIVRHRFATVTALCDALNRDEDHVPMLEATLGLIFFQCAVGRPDDDLPDIPWHRHFQAASSLVRRLQLTDAPLPLLHPPHGSSASTTPRPNFNMTLAAWIDILGASMLGIAPQFADAYRHRNFGGLSSGLAELMGCDDAVMYLISEIACLDALQLAGSLDETQLCGHITLVSQQVDLTEPVPLATTHAAAAPAITTSGALRPKQLRRTTTALFRCAARIWLCSLVPGARKADPALTDLVTRFAATLAALPAGPDGFDRCVVWPLLLAGAHSTPGSVFRHVLAERVAAAGPAVAGCGSLGRVVAVLEELWRQEDAVVVDLHWRDVMRGMGWDFLLI